MKYLVSFVIFSLDLDVCILFHELIKSIKVDRTDNDMPIEQLRRIYQATLLKSKRSRKFLFDNYHYQP